MKTEAEVWDRSAELVKRARAHALEHMFDALVVTDMDGRVVEWNRGSERLYGYTRGEMIGRSVSDLHIPEQRDHVLAEVMASVERTDRWQGEVGLLRKDGTRGWIESSVVMLHDEAGDPIGALGINRDISDRVNAEHKLAEEEARFRSLVENALVGIYMLRRESFLYVNPRFEAIFGYPAEELYSEVNVLDLVAAEDRSRLQRNIRSVLEGERLEQDYAFRGVRRDGVIIEVEVFGTLISWQGELAVIGMVSDVTARREAERRIRQSEERHRRIVDEMFERVAHLIASRERLRDKILHAGDGPGDLSIDASDQRFLSDVRAAIRAHLSDDSYTVEKLASDVAQSRSQLHRRLRALVDETPSRVMKRIRLEEAARLLATEGGSISDVAFAVGFKSTSHFSASFLDHYGLRPSVYREGHRS
jgi:PAS domain S-box-containing protein